MRALAFVLSMSAVVVVSLVPLAVRRGVGYDSEVIEVNGLAVAPAGDLAAVGHAHECAVG